jgi:hypothetical protein
MGPTVTFEGEEPLDIIILLFSGAFLKLFFSNSVTPHKTKQKRTL